ncbi:hypothetical protein EJ08DRAFT_588850 [Tothia fuscella]|uniref:Integral membrane protein n=1 Tax=Tothia fuscella TaxID=1048955 RepID=A0A9P4NS96_9PEZI|nr:hypothetical protein EJ08DRAFT_588850 [Tothia fuscella]
MGFLFAFWICLVSATITVWHRSTDNPTSWYFNPSIGYQSQYSNTRRQQADAFIRKAQFFIGDKYALRDGASPQASICIGVPTVARNGARYFRTTIGSLLEGLHPLERRRIFLISFIAHSDPTDHPAYSENWLAEVSDRVLTYSDNETMARMAELEGESEGYRQKALFDYRYLMQACVDTGLPYIGIIEDDVLALDGWFHRTMIALNKIADHSDLPNESKYLAYLRLFHTEAYLGWNVEEWQSYFVGSTFSLIIFLTILVTLRHSFPVLSPYLGNDIIGISCVVCFPLCVLLYFSSGRISIQPSKSTVQRMDNYGCCGQGLVYSRMRAQEIIPYYEQQKIGFADMITEQYAIEHRLSRWAVVPSVLQHMGHTSSKKVEDEVRVKDTEKKTIAEEIRSFSFEKHTPEVLRKEHDTASTPLGFLKAG